MGTPSHEILFGWKEIARHLQASIRTVQRWQRPLCLPTYHVRMCAPDHSAVYSFTDELDAWVRARPRLRLELNSLRGEVEQLRRENATLRSSHRVDASEGT